MADIEVKVKAVWDESDSKKSAKGFADALQRSLSRAFKSIGMDFGGGGKKEAGEQQNFATMIGVAVGTVIGDATGSVLREIVGLITDFPMITAILKLFKLILMILMLPLIPILKPILIGLGILADGLLPIMEGVSDGISSLFSGDFWAKVGAFFVNIVNHIKLVIANIGNFLTHLMANLWGDFIWLGNFLATIFDNVLSALINAGVDAANFITEGIQDGLNFVIDAINKLIEFFHGGDTSHDIGKIGIGKLQQVHLKIAENLFKGLTDPITKLVNQSVALSDAQLAAAQAAVSLSTATDKATASQNAVVAAQTETASTMTWFDPVMVSVQAGMKMAADSATLLAAANQAAAAKINIDSMSSLGGAPISRPGTTIGGWTNVGKKSKASGGVIGEEGQYYLHKGERVQSATEGKGGSKGGSNISINVNNPSVRNDNDIKQLVQKISFEMQRQNRRYTSYV